MNSHAPQPGDPMPPLYDEIRELAVRELGAALARVLTRNQAELLELAGRNPSHAMYILYMDAWEQIKDRHDELCQRFSQALFLRFGAAMHQERQNLAAEAIHKGELDLVAPEELELTLASNTISHALRMTCSEELRGIDHGMYRLLHDPQQRHGPHPLAPESLAEVVMEMMRTLPANNKIKLLLVTRLNVHLPEAVRQNYQRVNQFLLSHGFAPPPPQVTRARDAQTGTRPAADAQRALAAEDVAAGGQQPFGTDLFALLQQLMSMGRIGDVTAGAPPLPAPPGAAGRAAAPGLEAVSESAADTAHTLSLLTRIQHGEVSGLPGGVLEGRPMDDGTVNILRVIKHTGAVGNISPLNAMTLDIVALIFDHILDDRRLPDAMKALIGRLQIPILKVAMLDKTFFSHKQHPARKFLDLLADAALGWNPSEGHDSLFYQTVDTLVQQVLNDFEDRLDVFGEVLESLKSYLEQEKRQADERACLHAQLVQQTEQLAVAQGMAVDAVQARLLNHAVPEPIAAFLLGPWASHLAQAHRREGIEGATWNTDLQTVDDLVWSLSPKASKDDRQRLVGMLPGLLKRLDDGMEAVHLPRPERDQFFTLLVKHHADAVKLGLHGKLEAEAATAAPPRPSPPLPVFKYDSPELHDVPLPTGYLEADARILREISAVASPMEQEAAQLDLTVPIPAQEIAPMQGDIAHYEQVVANLKRGSWLEFNLPDDASLRAKLAWVSPLRGTYLFTNRLGERALSINAGGLARKLREGEARLLDSTALIDRAVSNVFNRLRRPT